ncbi:MAG: hypothetical protein L0H19_02595, partial [Salinisphaera sp.]|nr:hypothetical protein [Salinisphaera sp.]
MLPDLSTLSVQQIRMQFAGHGQAISPPLLEALKRDPRRGVQALYGLLLRRCKQERQEHRRILNMQRLERRLWGSGLLLVAGGDEAGEGLPKDGIGHRRDEHRALRGQSGDQARPIGREPAH